MRRVTLAFAVTAALAGTALAQTRPAPKPLSDYKAVQEQLYGLNYNVGERNGQLTPQLRSAITAWRTSRKSTITTDMTDAEAAILLSIPQPKVWASISYSATGAHGVVSGKPTRDAAEKEALAACEKLNKKCTVISTHGTGCAAVATYSGTVDGKPSISAFASFQPKLATAKDAALAACKKNAPQADACAPQDAVCADGSHKK